MEAEMEELHPQTPSKEPSFAKQSFLDKVCNKKGLEMEQKAGEGKGLKPESAGNEKCPESKPWYRSSSMDQSELESNSDDDDDDDCNWKRKRIRGAHWPHTAENPSDVKHSGESLGSNRSK